MPRRAFLTVLASGGASDTTAPTVTITSSESSPTAASPVPITITFSEAVTGFVIGDLTVGVGSASNFSGSGAVYTCDITPTGAAVTVDVAAGVCVDGAGNSNAAATQFAITATLVFKDTFTGLDGALLTSHIADINFSGQAWTKTGAGTWDLESNKAREITNAGNMYAHVNVGIADVSISAVVTLATSGGNYTGIMFRRSGADFWNFTLSPDRGANADWFFDKLGSGAAAVASGHLNFANSSTHTIRVDMSGDSIAIYIDGSLLTSTTDAYSQAATLHGLINNNGTAADKGIRVDMVTMTSL